MTAELSQSKKSVSRMKNQISKEMPKLTVKVENPRTSGDIRSQVQQRKMAGAATETGMKGQT